MRKRDPNLVKGFVPTELRQYVSRITSPTLYVIGGASRIVPVETQQVIETVFYRLYICPSRTSSRPPHGSDPATANSRKSAPSVHL